MPAVTPESPKVISPELADPLIWVELSDLVPEIIACELWVFASSLHAGFPLASVKYV